MKTGVFCRRVFVETQQLLKSKNFLGLRTYSTSDTEKNEWSTSNVWQQTTDKKNLWQKTKEGPRAFHQKQTLEPDSSVYWSTTRHCILDSDLTSALHSTSGSGSGARHARHGHIQGPLRCALLHALTVTSKSRCRTCTVVSAFVPKDPFAVVTVVGRLDTRPTKARRTRPCLVRGSGSRNPDIWIRMRIWTRFVVNPREVQTRGHVQTPIQIGIENRIQKFWIRRCIRIWILSGFHFFLKQPDPYPEAWIRILSPSGFDLSVSVRHTQFDFNKLRRPPRCKLHRGKRAFAETRTRHHATPAHSQKLAILICCGWGFFWRCCRCWWCCWVLCDRRRCQRLSCRRRTFCVRHCKRQSRSCAKLTGRDNKRERILAAYMSANRLASLSTSWSLILHATAWLLQVSWCKEYLCQHTWAPCITSTAQLHTDPHSLLMTTQDCDPLFADESLLPLIPQQPKRCDQTLQKLVYLLGRIWVRHESECVLHMNL